MEGRSHTSGLSEEDLERLAKLGSLFRVASIASVAGVLAGALVLLGYSSAVASVLGAAALLAFIAALWGSFVNVEELSSRLEPLSIMKYGLFMLIVSLILLILYLAAGSIGFIGLLVSSLALITAIAGIVMTAIGLYRLGELIGYGMGREA
ncbi:MAG: hypothetical protein LRS43_04110, partial [Desulfurococcales archaeon]|nr:hypothetical protein [Desulfurococcales archaeon]